MSAAVPAHSREVVRDLPNFRDNGRTVDTGLLRLIGRLQARHGRAYVSERSLRAMLHEDVGLMAGVSTIPKAMVRLRAQGLIVHEWLYAGQVLPDGSTATHGARIVWCPQNRRQRASARSFNATQDRRAGVRNRCVPASQVGRVISKLAAGKAPPTGDGATAKEREAAAVDAFERARAENLRKLAELEAAWAHEDKPPDG